jgi:hypothetical protein
MSPKEPPRIEEEPAPERSADDRLEKARKELQAEWDQRLACLNEPGASERVDAVMDARGRMKKRPIAGPTY